MNTIALLLFAAAAGLLWSRNMRYSVIFLSLEGVLLAVMVATDGPLTWATALVALATLAIKAVMIPLVVARMLQTWPPEVRRDHPLPLWGYGLAVIVVLAVGHVVHLLAPVHLIQHTPAFFYALSTIHLGLVMIVARRHLLSQMAALVGMENGLVVLSAALAGSLPTFVELGMIVDLGIAVTLMVWMSHRIHSHLQTADVASLGQLRG
jgi:hydrogenase-4 component E